jgi:hypothetical protein
MMEMLYRRFYDDKTNMSPGRFSRVGVVAVLMSHDLARLVTHADCHRLASRGSDDGREAVMHPAGEHLDRDRPGLGWAYLSAAGPDSYGFTTAIRDITAEGILETWNRVLLRSCI